MYEVDKEDAPEGCFAVAMNLDSLFGCMPCEFATTECPFRAGGMWCKAEHRPDGQEVIFISKEQED